MARIEYTGIVSQIRGKIAGTVFSKFQGGYTAYRKGSPRKQGSQAQQLVRNYFYAFAGAWRTLTETQRNDWRFVAANTPLYDRLGILRPINGFAYFVKFNQFLAGFLPTPQVDVTTDLEPAYPTTIVAAPATFSISAAGWILDDLPITLTTLGDSVYTNLALVYFSQPLPYADIVYHGTWYKAAAFPIAANLGISAEVEEVLTGVVMPAGFRSFPGALHRMKVELIAVESAQFAASSLADVPTSDDPFSFFPRLVNPDPTGESAVFRETSGSAFWELYWNRMNPISNPTLFNMETSVAFGPVGLTPPIDLDWIPMSFRPVLLPGAPNIYTLFSGSNAANTGLDFVAAVGTPLPAATGLISVYLRYRMQLISGGGWSPYFIQEFTYTSA